MNLDLAFGEAVADSHADRCTSRDATRQRVTRHVVSQNVMSGLRNTLHHVEITQEFGTVEKCE
jgi:hypothetical protein